jgi:hypothetical protein
MDAEKCILGAILLDNKAFQEADFSLNEIDFAFPTHQVIFRNMKEMIADKRDVDLVTIVDKIKRKKGQIEEVGGVAYLASLTEGLPRRASIEEYVRIVADKSVLRKLIDACSKGIISATNGHYGVELISETTQRLLSIIADNKAAWTTRPKRDVLIGGVDFMMGAPSETEWAVHGLIQRIGNGLIVGDPGTSKSLLTLKLAFHLVTAYSFMGRFVPRALRVGYIAREDAPGLTQQRSVKLMEGFDQEMQDRLHGLNLNDWLYFNTRAQTATFSLQKEADVQEIIEAFKAKGIEFAIFDVFRRLWEGDENDNQEVAKVLASLTRIQTECNCSVLLVHHVNKAEGGTIFQRIRGASAIYGWREFAFGLTIENPEEEYPENKIRKIEFETKADTPSKPIYYKIVGSLNSVAIEQCEAPPPLYRKKKSAEIAVPTATNGNTQYKQEGGLF